MPALFEWGTETRYNSYTEFLKNKFGGRVQKLSIDAGFSCPNRDGTKGIGGCTYCCNDAFNPSYCDPAKPVQQQLKEGIQFHDFRYRRAIGFIAYFQAYTNTYAPISKIIKLYEEALEFPGIVGLAIGTRPDCMNDEILDYLSLLNEKYFITVEYGLESCYDETLKRINRGHTYKESITAIRNTVEKGLQTGIHLILGLPGETEKMMIAEAGFISELPVNSIKFHQLQILKGTKTETEYHENPGSFKQFSMEEYIDFVIKFIERLNPTIMIDRFLSEVPPRFLSGKGWGQIRYDEVLRLIVKRFTELDTWQGKCYKE